jgi:hypothetical protein
MRIAFLLFVLSLFPITVIAQQGTPVLRDRNAPDRPLNNKEVSVDGERPPVTDYLIISQDRDTTYVDTTLNIYKDYKFNYLRQDNFELLPFHNVGQPYNRLAKTFDMDQLSPGMGAMARHDNYYEVEDINDYHVPTPLTELYFKTVVNQGQQLDALFTSNISPRFNFSISYKGVRSAGDYVNTLTSTGNFKFTSSYSTNDDRYRLRVHATFQDLTNQESGGLTPESLEGFITEDEDLDDRGRLEPNLLTGESLLEGRRFYLDHDYEIFGKRDSTQYYSLRAYNKAFYEDKFYRYSEDTSTESFLGPAYVSSSVKDKTNFEEGAIELGAVYDHYILGYYKAGIARRKFNYGYDRVVNRENGLIDSRIIAELYQFKAQFKKRIGKFDLSANGAINVAGDVDGQYVNGQASYLFKDILFTGYAAVNSSAPELNLQLRQSDYILYNWQNNFSNVESQQLGFKMQSDRFFDLDVNVTTLQDYAYFESNQVFNDAGEVTGFTALPRQTNEELIYLKVKAHKEFKFLNHFGSDHTIMYQTVQQDEAIINVPSITTRNTVYYKNRFFKNALLLQTGVTMKYFDEYFMDGYDPVLGEFYTQDNVELGAFPLVDIFLNAKVRQTRIFFKLEHVNALFTEPTYFSAPRHPYRDFTLRFGLVWNFFL